MKRALLNPVVLALARLSEAIRTVYTALDDFAYSEELDKRPA